MGEEDLGRDELDDTNRRVTLTEATQDEVAAAIEECEERDGDSGTLLIASR